MSNENLPDDVNMIVDGVVGSSVGAGEKGVGLKVTCKCFGETYRVFIPTERVKGEQLLKMFDPVKIHFRKFFQSNGEVRMDARNVFLESSKK